MADEPSLKGMAGTIPLFFYDLIGRILPGAILIVGSISYFNRNRLTSWDAGIQTLQTVFPKESSAGYSLAALLLFIGVAQFLGFVLSSLSFDLVERPWGKYAEIDIQKITTDLALQRPNELQERFHRAFGHDIPGSSLNQASFLCAYYAWTKNSNLGMMTARWDAEALAGRALVFITFLFTLMPFVTLFWSPWSTFDLFWVMIWSVTFLATCFAYNYLRMKRMSGRFGILLALSTPAAEARLDR